MRQATAQYLAGLRVVPERLTSPHEYPGSLPFVATLDLTFSSAVTIFVGENGCGKSTLLEAIAALSRLPVGGGSRSDVAAAHAPDEQAALAEMYNMVGTGNSQFIIATHSPILMTYPGADLLSFDDPALPPVKLEDTSHFQITKGMLDNPARYWKHLTDP